MSETQTQEQEVSTQVAPPAVNPFEESSWAETPVVEQNGTVEPPQAGSQAPVQPTAAVPPVQEEEDQIITPDVWLKEQLGYETVDAAKKEIEELRKLRGTAQTPAQIKFANEQSEKFFEALKEGKEDDIYHYLSQKKTLERLEKMELKGVQEAAEIIKAGLQFKHPDLTSEEVNFLYNKRYSFPAKPRQSEDQDDADYAIELDAWQQSVKEKEQEMIIEAKLARPDLVKFKSELVLPDIPKAQPEPQAPAPDPEFEAKVLAWKGHVVDQLGSNAAKFNGFNVMYKDEAVEIPIAFKLTDEEKSSTVQMIKEQVLGEQYNFNDYFNKRWFDEKGNPNVNQMIHDVYLMNNAEKVFQKFANEAATQRLIHKAKEASNIQITQTPQGTFNPQTTQNEFDKMASHFWSQ